MPDEEQRGKHARQGTTTAGGLLLHRAWGEKGARVANHMSEGLCTGEQRPAQGVLKTSILSLGFILGATGIRKDHVGEGDSTMEAAIVPNLTEEAGDSPPCNPSAHWHSSAYHLHKLFLLTIWKKL